jgi:hypothetical protein
MHDLRVGDPCVGLVAALDDKGKARPPIITGDLNDTPGSRGRPPEKKRR